jgi:hypothetical protein
MKKSLHFMYYDSTALIIIRFIVDICMENMVIKVSLDPEWKFSLKIWDNDFNPFLNEIVI